VPEEEQGMVEYEGMLVSGAVAQRRGWVVAYAELEGCRRMV
jgi:hypothetical protein